MEDVYITSITSTDDFSDFYCVEDELNKWLKEDAWWYEERNLSKTYILKKIINHKIIGYSTVVMSCVKKEGVEDIFTKEIKSIPSYKLARLAVIKEYSKQGYGEFLLSDALYHAKQLSKEIGCRIMEVDSKENAIDFYERYGFKKMQIGTTKYYMDLQTLD
jgi:ribosomal protein S18 acetylase RimI-like enzyme